MMGKACGLGGRRVLLCFLDNMDLSRMVESAIMRKS